jgi:predicted alpha/beta superfamily hydrolase
LADTQSRNLTSAATGRTYQISVSLPENYATFTETYPVLYAVDANTQFGTVVETARRLRRFENSCGGGFAFQALLEGEGTFERVIAGSPNPRLVRQLESDYAQSHDSLRAQLFLSSGLLLDEPFPEIPSELKEFVTILEARHYSGLQIKTAYFEDETHIMVIPATIGRGLRAVYEGFPRCRHSAASAEIVSLCRATCGNPGRGFPA